MKPSSSLVAVIVLSLLLAAGLGGYAYLLSSIASRVEEEGALAATASQTLQRDAGLRSMENLLRETAADRERLALRVIGKDGVAAFLSLLEDAGGVSVASVTLADGGWKHHELVRVTFVASGSFAALTELLTTLESLPYPARIERAYFEKTGDEWLGSFTISAVKAR
jgi:hypothetical protein